MASLDNNFTYILRLNDDLTKFKRGALDLHGLAHSLVMMGMGKVWNDKTQSVEFPSERTQQLFNEAVHTLLKEHDVLRELRAYFTFESKLDQNSPHKMLFKPYDEDMVSFLQDEADPRYFPQD